MEQPQLRFDSYLQMINSNDLQRMARIWGAHGSLRKDAALVTISEGLADTRIIDTVIAQLDSIELAALAIMRSAGGIIRASHLTVALRTAGFEPPATPDLYGNTSAPFAQHLCQRGIAIQIEQRYGGYSAYNADLMVFSDERLLARIPGLTLKQISLPAAPEPSERRIRRPAQVALDLIGIVEAVRAQGGLQLTKSNTVRVTDLRKLSKTLGWGEVENHFDGLLFTRPVQALVETLTNSGHLVAIDSERLMVSNADLAALPYPDMVAEILGRFIGLQGWYEYDLPYWSETFANTGTGMRLAMLTIFECMLDTHSFVSLETFSRALFDRIGQYYSLNGPHPRVPRPWNMQRPRGRTKAEPKTTVIDEQAWIERLWAEWRLYEERWMTYALAGWLYFLGLVEVGIQEGQLNALRLTDLGRALMRPTEPAITEPIATPWIIQPNYEIVVYLEQAAPAQLALLERSAERIQADIHVARYRLTRESIARWIDRSGTLDSLFTALGPAIPQNVTATIREWATQHERITLRRRASILNYPTAAARDAALSNGVAGRPIGDRYVLLDTADTPIRLTMIIDYLEPPPATLKIEEQGQIEVVRGQPDLLTEPLLDRWAERVGEHWKLTAASVGEATRRGHRIDDFLRELDQRLIRVVPPVLKLAMRAWAGDPAQAALGRISILRLADPDVANALISSRRFLPLIHGQAGDRILLIERANLPEIRELLQWAGIKAEEIDE